MQQHLARFRTHILGNFGASKKTGQTYGTLTTLTAAHHLHDRPRADRRHLLTG
jgi:hypothetical protein